MMANGYGSLFSLLASNALSDVGASPYSTTPPTSAPGVFNLSGQDLLDQLQKEMDEEREREKKWWKKRRKGQIKDPKIPPNKGLARQIAKEYPNQRGGDSGGGDGSMAITSMPLGRTPLPLREMPPVEHFPNSNYMSNLLGAIMQMEMEWQENEQRRAALFEMLARGEMAAGRRGKR